MIELWPAIDLIGGQSVRLTEGDYDTSLPMTRTPSEAIAYYETFSAVKRIHLVDLIGAREKKPQETGLIAQLIRQSRLPVEIGGGIRSREIIDEYFELGAGYLVIGTRGLLEPDWLAEMARAYPGRLYLGLDAKGTVVAINGWKETILASVFDVVRQVEKLPLGGVIYTDIRKDGRMAGPSFELTGQLAAQSRLPVIASGGIRHKADIDRLEALGAFAAIVGKAANTEAFWEDFK